jgi:D-sedoheptulose 7-phosphate isomerase
MSALRPDTLRHIGEVLERCPQLEGVCEQIRESAEAICACHRARGKVLVCGNGGSASDSEHIVGELAKGFVLRRGIPEAHAVKLRATSAAGGHAGEEIAARLQGGVAAISLAGHPALASAVDNDIGREMIFAQQAYVYGRPGDILIGLSTSGNSGNILRALIVARAFGVKTIGLTGSQPAAMDSLCDILIKTPGTETHKIQELHLPVYHTICLMVEQELFGRPQAAASS